MKRSPGPATPAGGGRTVTPPRSATDSLGLSHLCVEDCRWSNWPPGLPAELAAFLAEPTGTATGDRCC